ncbi:MAG: transglutaminase domain-containing protein [Deltaproteobacteria bacterium]|nr:transglutaminase domain-containing protein [Deltaproteobacteria bacterium]
MRVDAVSLDAGNPMVGAMWSELLRPREATLYDSMQPAGTVFGRNTAQDIFGLINPQQTYELEERERAGFLQMVYLQYPNKIIKDKALSIVSPGDDDDTKANKLHKWILENFLYITDAQQYGREELWVPPVMSLRKGSGDCEDGAFLLHSLMLNAGIPADRIRTYGGMVKVPGTNSEGGHAWTAYRRESDNQWVVLDTSYYPNPSHVSSLPLMTEDIRYVDDIFFITLNETVITEATNRIRDPEILPVYTQNASLDYNPNQMAGMWLNDYA